MLVIVHSLHMQLIALNITIPDSADLRDAHPRLEEKHYCQRDELVLTISACMECFPRYIVQLVDFFRSEHLRFTRRFRLLAEQLDINSDSVEFTLRDDFFINSKV